MLPTAARARLTVVLVGARNPSNIGAAARAMQDFGFSDLRIVNDFAAPFEAAQLEVKSAVAAQHVMHSARRFDALAPAIADCSLVVATTAIGDRELTLPILTLQQAAPHILQTLNAPQRPPSAQDMGAPCLASETWEGDAVQRPPSAQDLASETWEDDEPQPSPSAQPRVALLFGSEKTGLTREQLSHATLLTTIPMFAPDAARHLSMNLGQSVAVCLYELTRSGFESSIDIPTLHEAPATADDRERLTHLLLDVLRATGYTRRFPANSSEPLIRQLAQHLGQTHREAMTLMGILRQVLWHEDNHVTP